MEYRTIISKDCPQNKGSYEYYLFDWTVMKLSIGGQNYAPHWYDYYEATVCLLLSQAVEWTDEWYDRETVLTEIKDTRDFSDISSAENRLACYFAKSVRPGSYYETAVIRAVQNGITQGMPQGFCPETICTRARIVSFLYRFCRS